MSERGCRLLSAAEFDYADGAESSLLSIVENATDISVMSDELEAAASSWPEFYHLTKSRANVLRGLTIRPTHRILEIGAGCGPVTRYLGECGAEVDAVEPMPQRAVVARARTRDLDNVQVFVGLLEDIPSEPAYDLVIINGVLEYVGGGSTEDEPYLAFLGHARKLLRPGGAIACAIENRLGVKYLAGSPEDHTGVPFEGIENYQIKKNARTFTRRMLEDLFDRAGLRTTVLHAFPDYKTTRWICSDAVFHDQLLKQLAVVVPPFPSPDPAGWRAHGVDENSLWKALNEESIGTSFANSFLVIGNESADNGWWPTDQLGVLCSTDRKQVFAAETRLMRNSIHDRGAADFVRRRLGDEPSMDGEYRHVIEESASFIRGTRMVELLSGGSDSTIEAQLAAWKLALESSDTLDGYVPIDFIPSNIMVLEDGELRPFDQEWHARRWTKADVLARGVFDLSAHLARTTSPGRWPHQTIGELAESFAGIVGLPEDGSWKARFIELETDFLSHVRVHQKAADGNSAPYRERTEKWLIGVFDQRLDEGPLGKRDWDILKEERQLRERVEWDFKHRIEDLNGVVDSLRTELAVIRASRRWRYSERAIRLIRRR
jgi:precorrin-6B methylase 2